MVLNTYKLLLQKKSEDYEKLLNAILHTRIEDNFNTYAIMCDRGSKADYVQSYYYDLLQVENFVSTNVEKGVWFTSIYLSWLLHETYITKNNLSISFDVFCEFVENNLYRKIIEKNRYECYGFCMSALTILDKELLTDYHGEKRYTLLKLAIEGIVTYLYYHIGVNILWDSEMYSNYARLFDRYKSEMMSITMSLLIGSYPQYSYCYGMYEAYLCAPAECPYKLEYHKNALMMQQNQTVVSVTKDAMDASFLDAVALGKKQFLVYTKKMLQYYIVDESELNGMKDYVGLLNLEYNKKIAKNPGFENLRCLERYFQLEPYDKEGYIFPPYKKTAIDYHKLLNHLGVKERDCKKMDLNDGETLVCTPMINIFPHFHKSKVGGNTDSSSILFVRMIVRPDESINSIIVIGLQLYELYRDISTSELFFDIPCLVGQWDPQYEGGMDYMILLAGTNNDIKHYQR